MVRRVFLAFLVFGLVACGDDGIGPQDIAGTYTLQTVNGEPSPFFTLQSLNPDGFIELSALAAAHTVLGPQSSCTVSLTFETTIFDSFRNLLVESSMTETNPCTFVFTNGALTLNYTDGKVETGSIVGSTLTITRNGALWVFRK